MGEKESNLYNYLVWNVFIESWYIGFGGRWSRVGGSALEVHVITLNVGSPGAIDVIASRRLAIHAARTVRSGPVECDHP